MIQRSVDWQRLGHRDFDVLERLLIEANKVKRGASRLCMRKVLARFDKMHSVKAICRCVTSKHAMMGT